jgi:hypothetical protein
MTVLTQTAPTASPNRHTDGAGDPVPGSAPLAAADSGWCLGSNAYPASFAG